MKQVIIGHDAQESQVTREIVLETSHLTKKFGKHIAVDNLDLQIYRGDVFGLLGPNGSGKTTTIRMIVDLVRSTHGNIILFGQSSKEKKFPSSELRRVGSLIEQPTFYPFLSGRENLTGTASFAGMPDNHTTQIRINETLELVELETRSRDAVKTYSLGMKQRLGIAAALLHHPELVILDEPTNGLDPEGVLSIRHIIKRIAQQGSTILISSHLLYEVEQMCSHVAILKQGKLLVQDEVRSLLHSNRKLILSFDDFDVFKSACTTLQNLALQYPWLSGYSLLQVNSEDEKAKGGQLLVDAPVEYAATLNRLLAEQKIYAEGIRHQESSLESFFLQLTGSEKRSSNI